MLSINWIWILGSDVGRSNTTFAILALLVISAIASLIEINRLGLRKLLFVTRSWVPLDFTQLRHGLVQKMISHSFSHSQFSAEIIVWWKSELLVGRFFKIMLLWVFDVSKTVVISVDGKCCRSCKQARILGIEVLEIVIVTGFSILLRLQNSTTRNVVVQGETRLSKLISR